MLGRLWVELKPCYFLLPLCARKSSLAGGGNLFLNNFIHRGDSGTRCVLWVHLHFLQGEEQSQCQFYLKTLLFASSMVNFSISCNITSWTCGHVTKSTVNTKAFWRWSRCSFRMSSHNTLQTSAPGKVLGEILRFPPWLKKAKLLPRPYKLFQKLPKANWLKANKRNTKYLEFFRLET